MSLIISIVINAIALLLVAYLVPGFRIASFGTALIVALVLGILNALVRPLLLLLTLPINILTLGLFTLVINAIMLLLASRIVPGFTIEGFGSALIGGILLWAISWLTNGVLRGNA